MIPVLYSPLESEFKSNGLGMLTDCVSCSVTEKDDGFFELSASYPVSGKRFNDITMDAIIKAKPNKYSSAQLFRIYSISKPMRDHTSISAQHISYDLSGIPVRPFSANSVKQAVEHLNSDRFVASRFNISTDIDLECDISFKIPVSTRSAIFEIAEICCAEIEFDNFNVRLLKSRGIDRGFSVRYGKNMKSLVQDEYCADVVTGILPYWFDQQTEELVMLADPVMVDGYFTHDKIIPVDLTSFFDNKPTEKALSDVANTYVIENDIGKPEVSLDVSFVHTGSDNVFLHDLVNVIFPRLKVSTKAKVNNVVYNVLLNRVQKASIGTVKRSIVNTLTKK